MQKTFIRYVSLCAILFAALTTAHPQGFDVQSRTAPSVTTVDSAKSFVSLDGRFSITLSETISGFRDISQNTALGRVPGVSYTWRMAEGLYTVSLIDKSDALRNVDPKASFDAIRDSMVSRLKSVQGNLSKEENLQLGDVPGRGLRFELPDNGLIIFRVYQSNIRIYQVSLLIPKEQIAQEAVAMKALDSFKILGPADAEAAMKKKIADATPAALPQSPVAKKEKSDAEDEKLKGKVKIVADEDEDLSGTWSVGGRKPSSSSLYNEAGNLTETRRYDYRGNLSDITVYGYIDGDRVENSNYIRYEYDPPPMMAPPGPAGQTPPKRDNRYNIKYKYKYDPQGRMIEKVFYRNDGSLGWRYVSNYKDNTLEELSYDPDGKLSSKYLTILDDKGLRKERSETNLKDGSIRTRYSYTYEFDSHGNWVKQTTSTWTTKDGAGEFKPAYVTYRTITYY